MPSYVSWTDAQVAAWDYIKSAVENEMGVTAAYNDYRAGGGAIRRQDFFREFNTAKEYGTLWQQLDTFQMNETIPERFYQPAPRNFEQKYVAEVHFDFRNAETGELERGYRYIESDYRMSQSEIENALNELGEDYPQGDSWTPEFIYGYNLYKKGD